MKSQTIESQGFKFTKDARCCSRRSGRALFLHSQAWRAWSWSTGSDGVLQGELRWLTPESQYNAGLPTTLRTHEYGDPQYSRSKTRFRADVFTVSSAISSPASTLPRATTTRRYNCHHLNSNTTATTKE